MVIMYGRSTFNSVQDRYLAYHQQIHKQLLALKREEIETIAKTEELDQENTALRVQGAMAASSERPEIRYSFISFSLPPFLCTFSHSLIFSFYHFSLVY